MIDNLEALLLFAVSASFTPGPNNLMVTSSGANFGYRRSLPHMLGVALGFPAMFLAMGLGLVQVFAVAPGLHDVLRYLGGAYMLYLAFRIATARSVGKADQKGRPLTFIEAALFQWINPKAVMFVLSVLTAFTTPDGNLWQQTLVMAAIFAIVAFASISTWCLFGTAIGRLLTSQAALRAFNIAMAAALVLSMFLIFRQ